MWSPEINLLGAICHNAAKYQWHGWTHSGSAGWTGRPKWHNTCVIGLSTIIVTPKTTLKVYLKCRYYQDREKKDRGPAEATEHWYELYVEDVNCVFGRKVLVEIYSYPEDYTYAIHKNAFDVARDMAIFCTDTTRYSRKELVMIVSDLINAPEPLAPTGT
jgi:hypothetical protein